MKNTTTVADFLHMAEFLSRNNFPTTSEVYIKEGFEGIYLCVEADGKREVFKIK